MFNTGTKLCFINNPQRCVEVIKPMPHEYKMKGKRTDGTIVPMTFVLMITEEFPKGIRAWFPTDQLRPI